MPTNPFFSGRIPQGLYEAIEKHRHQTGESKTEVLVRALSSYIQHPVELPPSGNSSKSQEIQRIETIEAEIKQINGKIFRLYENMGKALGQSMDKPLNVPQSEQMVIKGIEQESSAKATERQYEKTDNNFDNSIDNNSETAEDKAICSEPARKLIGRLTNTEIPPLVKASSDESKRINVKLNNAKSQKSKKTKIGNYTCEFAGYTEERGKNGRHQMLWDVYEDN